MKWIKNHKLISTLLTVIVVSLLVLVVSVATGGKGNAVTNVFSGVYSAIERPLTKIASTIYNNVSGVFTYKDVQSENETLKKENEELKQQMNSLILSANELKELKELSKALNYDGVKGNQDIVTADVVSMDGTNWMNVFTINKGTESNIKENDVVVCGSGLVGRIHSTGRGWSKVVSIIDESSKISFKIDGNLQMIGVVEGSMDGVLSGFMLNNKAKVSEGDKLVTSGMGIFPSGIELGKITKVQYDSDSQLQRVKIKSSVEFMSLQKVTVVL